MRFPAYNNNNIMEGNLLLHFLLTSSLKLQVSASLKIMIDGNNSQTVLQKLIDGLMIQLEASLHQRLAIVHRNLINR